MGFTLMWTVNTLEAEMEQPLAVVLGAGPVGLTVGKIFQERGHAVRYVTRSGRPVNQGRAETRAADLRDPAAVVQATAGASVIVHAAGIPYQDWTREFPLMQTAVLEAARSGAVLALAENLYSFTADAMPLTETSPEVPPTKKGALRLALSRQWLEAQAAGSVRAVSIRASDYFGPGATRSPNSHFGQRFFPAFEAGKPVAFLGNPDAPHSFTYLPDYARALVDAALDPAAWGRAWICPSIGPTSARTVAQRFAAEAGTSVRVSRLPSAAVKLLGLFNPLIREVVEMLYQFEREFTVDTSAFEGHFGWKATDLAQAVRETWAAHRA